MRQYLVEHAIQNVWSSPRQDSQLVIAPKRISPPRGFLNQAVILEELIPLPEKKRHFHLFHLGQADPFTIELIREKPNWRRHKWIKFSEAVNKNNLEVTIYDSKGVNLPRNDCYYLFTSDRSIVFAVPENNRQRAKPIINYRDVIYFRLYKNHFFKRPNINNEYIKTGYFTPQNTNEILEVESKLKALANNGFKFRAFVNGLLTDQPSLLNIKPGDYVEWVIDTSIKRMVEWKLSDLHQFRSELDDTYKYLLHYEGDSDRTIDFQDDIDVYVLYKDNSKPPVGLYYNRNASFYHRMLTHRDYSVVTSNVMFLKDELLKILDVETSSNDNVYVRVYIREGGLRRQLVLENQRIFELYKLNEENRYRALIGVDALVPEWYCPNLEKSAYTRLMREDITKLDLSLVEEAYGYNACSVLLANTPQKLENDNGLLKAFLPYGLTQKSTVYEFDSQGLLLGYRNHNNDDSYEPTSEECVMIEAVLGESSHTLDCYYGQDNLPFPDSTYSYRVYLCYLKSGTPDNKWTDITDNEFYYYKEGNKLKWKPGGLDHWLMVRTDKKILALDLQVKENDGLVNFSLLENPTGNPVDDLEPMSVPLAQLDIWLNRHKLVRGLDYFVKFPQVFITNKTLLKQPLKSAIQDVHVRMMRLPDSDMQFDTIEETGWVLNGSLSNNNRFDLRDDKVLQINVGGRIFHREDLLFGEDRPNQSLLNIMNGLPYQIKDIIVPMKGKVQTDTYRFRKLSQEIDKRVSDYMTLKYENMDNHDLSAITARYPLVSPFFSHIVFLLMNRLIQLPEERILSDLEVKQICKIHEGLLDFDPLKDTNRPDENFAYIIPHGNENPYEVDFQAYRFLLAVERIYGQGKIKISDYIKLRQE